MIPSSLSDDEERRKMIFFSRILFISVIIEKEVVCTSESRWTAIIIKSPSYSVSSDIEMICEEKREEEEERERESSRAIDFFVPIEM